MAISILGNQTTHSTYLKTPPEDAPTSKRKKYDNVLDEAIDAYKDEVLTGLTEEEKEEIDKLIKAYLKEHKLRTKADKDALLNYTKGLLKDFGYKGDYDACAAALCTGAIKEAEVENASLAQTAYAKERTFALAGLEKTQTSMTPTTQTDLQTSSKNSGDEIDHKDETISKVVTNPDGSKTLLTIRNDVIVSKVQIDSGTNQSAHNNLNVLTENMDKALSLLG